MRQFGVGGTGNLPVPLGNLPSGTTAPPRIDGSSSDVGQTFESAGSRDFPVPCPSATNIIQRQATEPGKVGWHGQPARAAGQPAQRNDRAPLELMGATQT